MNNDDWKLQVSYKTPGGDMINIRANTADELSVLLEGISDYSPQIAATAKMIQGAYTTLPLVTPASTPATPPEPYSVPDQAKTASPTCIHGPRIYRSGISKNTGKPYAFWACPTPQGTPDQCKPVN
jgi:hypothetical protein